jgi:hypothetical protein
MKMTKARRIYKCHNCSGAISKGDLYLKKTVSIGSPHKPVIAVKTKGGGVAYEAQGFRYAVQICAPCAAE